MTMFSIQYGSKEISTKCKIYLNGRVVDGDKYDAVFWAHSGEDYDALTSWEFDGLRVLVVDMKDVKRSVSLTELGYG